MMSQRTDWQHRGRGGHWHGYQRKSNDDNQESESYPSYSQRGRGFFRGRGRGFNQRGHAPHRGNRGFPSTQGISRDMSTSHRGSKQVVRGGRRMPKPEQKFLDFPFIEHNETVNLMAKFQVMFILRGLPGSGKSTVADAILKQHRNHAVVCSADYYRYNKYGEYVWHEDTLQETHNKCQRRAEKFAALNKPVIIIDNTNVRYSEVEPYINIATQYGYVIVLVEPKTPWKFQAGELSAKNKHNVSFPKICRRLEQYDDILPHYFGWFLSPGDSASLKTMAKDVLWKCLKIPEFQQCIKAFSGDKSVKFTVHNALSYYSIKQSDHNHYHVTACFSPKGKYLFSLPYHKSSVVQKDLGRISQLSVVGFVLTNHTFSARVLLTNKQHDLWMNEDDQRSKISKRDEATSLRDPVEEVTKSFQNLPLEDSGEVSNVSDHCTDASTHITLGTKQDVSPVQAKYDVQSIINYENLSSEFEEYTLKNGIGTLKKYTDNIWAVYLHRPVKLQAIFSGYY